MKYLLTNFKTNKNWTEINSYFNELQSYYDNNKQQCNNHTVFFLNALYAFVTKMHFSNYQIGCQSGSELGTGAFTSSISLEQLSAENINHILLGHSEEYKYFNQTLSRVNKAVIKSLELGLKVYLCFGNQDEILDDNELTSHLLVQLNELLANINPEKFTNIVLAYEPIYAIGTSKAMSSVQANNVIKKLKQNLLDKYKHNFPIVYGGSVNLTNIHDFISSENIDGVLVGKEALEVSKMKEMISIVYGK